MKFGTWYEAATFGETLLARRGRRRKSLLRTWYRTSGVTLVELMLVLALLAAILGLGAGMFASIDVERREAAGLVASQLRAARSAALSRHGRARVRADLASGAITAHVESVIGTWQFEDETLEGAFGASGTSIGAALTEQGFVGRALAFDVGARGPRASLAVNQDGSCDLSDGFALECALRASHVGAGMVADVGGAVGLTVEPDGAIRGWFRPLVIRPDGAEGRGGAVAVESAPGRLRVGRWTRVRLEYDRTALALLIDGQLAARIEEGAPVWKVEGALTLSDERVPFRGAIDAVVLSAVTAATEARLPRSVRFAPGTPAEIAFDASGGLDRTRHEGAIRIGLDHEDGTREWVQVGLYGTVE